MKTLLHSCIDGPFEDGIDRWWQVCCSITLDEQISVVQSIDFRARFADYTRAKNWHAHLEKLLEQAEITLTSIDKRNGIALLAPKPIRRSMKYIRNLHTLLKDAYPHMPKAQQRRADAFLHQEDEEKDPYTNKQKRRVERERILATRPFQAGQHVYLKPLFAEEVPCLVKIYRVTPYRIVIDLPDAQRRIVKDEAVITIEEYEALKRKNGRRSNNGRS